VPVDERHGRGRRNRVVLARPCTRQVGGNAHAMLPATVARAGSPRRVRISRKPLRREGRLSPPVPVVLALAQLFFAQGPGCSGHPAFPAPSDFREGDGRCKARANSVARRGTYVLSTVIARSVRDEAIQGHTQGPGLLRGACHRAALCAVPLAQQ